MNLKCPNCSEFKFNKVTTGKWTFGFWNLVVYFFGVTSMFGTKDHSTSDNYTTTHEELFGIPVLIWGFLVIIIYTPFLFIRKYIHNKKYKRNVMYCSNCQFQQDINI